MGIVVLLHIFGKLRSAGGGAPDV